MDVFDRVTRSRIMARVKSKNTKPELRIRTFLFKRGFRFRLHVQVLPGTPDIVLKKYNTAIFVHGCFWHSHPGCRYSSIPKTDSNKWSDKLHRNEARDMQHINALLALGWNVIVIWQCGINKKNFEFQLEWLEPAIKNNSRQLIIWPNLV